MAASDPPAPLATAVTPTHRSTASLRWRDVP
jgi:hypothetical protein